MFHSEKIDKRFSLQERKKEKNKQREKSIMKNIEISFFSIN